MTSLRLGMIALVLGNAKYVDDFAKSIEGFYKNSIIINIIWGGILFLGILV